MLHIHNGDCSAEVLKQSGLSGEHIAWREALIAGPNPGDLSYDEWLNTRADFLAEAYELDKDDCRRDLQEQHEALSKFSSHEEVLLWFEHDLFCQIHLIYLLNWFSSRKLGKTKLSLVCINEFPGVINFRGLGQLTPDQMSSLFDNRVGVTDRELVVAKQAWEAYSSSDPTNIETFLSNDTSPLPFLKDALLAHLARFPSTSNGLGRIEDRALELIQSGVDKFISLFQNFGDSQSAYGLGDYQFWCDLKRLIKAKEPLLIVNGLDDVDSVLVPDKLSQISFSITDMGKKILARQTDFIDINGIDLWLGGVHLSNKDSLWRWNEQKQQLTKS
jgi:hypothetical protein